MDLYYLVPDILQVTPASSDQTYSFQTIRSLWNDLNLEFITEKIAVRNLHVSEKNRDLQK